MQERRLALGSLSLMVCGVVALWSERFANDGDHEPVAAREVVENATGASPNSEQSPPSLERRDTPPISRDEAAPSIDGSAALIAIPLVSTDVVPLRSTWQRPVLRGLREVFLRAVPRIRRAFASAHKATPEPPTSTLSANAQTEVAVRTAIHALIPLAQYCYDQNLKRDPRLQGKTTFRLQLDGSAKVVAVHAEGDLHAGDQLTRCLGASLSKALFPIEAADMSIEVPFLLRPAEEGTQLATNELR